MMSVNTETAIGVVEDVRFGKGGYQDCMLGLSLTLRTSVGSVGTFVNGGWTLERSSSARWTEVDRANQQSDMCQKIIELLESANVDDITKLKGKPVQVTFENSRLKDWRILKEAIL